MIRKYSKNKYDRNGELASSGQINEIVLEQAQQLYLNRINKKNYHMIQTILIFHLLEGYHLRMGKNLIRIYSLYNRK